jgi:hypothetical protein
MVFIGVVILSKKETLMALFGAFLDLVMKKYHLGPKKKGRSSVQ